MKRKIVVYKKHYVIPYQTDPKPLRDVKGEIVKVTSLEEAKLFFRELLGKQLLENTFKAVGENGFTFDLNCWTVTGELCAD